jgi:hypothetical protein
LASASDLRGELRAIVPTRPGRALARLISDGDRLARLRLWCRSALARAHLVTAARLLDTELGATSEQLEALGIPVDVLAAFPVWKRGSRRGFRPPPLGLVPPPAGARHPIEVVRLQLPSESSMAALGLLLLRDLPARMDPATHFVVAAWPGAQVDAVRAIAGRIAPRATGQGRIRVVGVASSTVFAQDGARGARTRDGEPALLVPRGFEPGGPRALDRIEPSHAAALGVPVVRTRSYWEGGNLVHDDDVCFVGADTIALNRARLGLTDAEAKTLLAADLGIDIECLGAASGQDTFHIDLDVALLGRVGRRGKIALVSDPGLGLELADHVLRLGRPFAGQFLPPAQLRAHVAAEYEAEAHARFQRLSDYSETLERAGYRVIGVPSLRVGPRRDVYGLENLRFGYGNVLPGRHRGRPAVYYLPFGIAALDRAAEARYRAAGCEPVAVSRNPRLAGGLMRESGGLRCACGSL